MNNLVFNISFHVRHPAMPSTKIVEELGLAVRSVRSVGENRATPKGTLLEGTYAETYCSFLLQTKTTGHLDKHLGIWCAFLEKHGAFLHEISGTGGNFEFYISIFLDGDRGFVLENRLLHRMDALGVGLSVEMYRLNDEEASAK